MLKLIKPAIVLFLTCVIVTGLLALTYSNTKDIIKERELETLRAAREKVLAGAQIFEETDDENIFVGKNAEGVIVGVVVTVTVKGYGGDVRVAAGIRTDGTVEAAEIVEHTETPGLGAKITLEGFLSQFRDADPGNGFVVVKGTSTSNTEIEAISGATISTKAVADAVNTAAAAAKTALQKAGE